AYGIEDMIPESGPGLTLVMLIALPFIWALPQSLVAAELGSARPQEGGYYKWVQEALGEYWGFQAGWWRTISIYVDNTIYVVLAGGYIASYWSLSPGAGMAIKIAMILVMTYINIRGVKDVGSVSTALSALVIFAFAMIAICGFMNWTQNPFVPFTADGEIMGVSGIAMKDWIYYIGMGISIGMWMYSGYESMSTIAGEIKNPMVIPKGTLLALPLIMSVYVFSTLGGLASLGRWDEWGTEPGTIGYADVVQEFWGAGFAVFFVIVAVLAQCSIYNTYIASGSRGFFALADDHLAPPIFVKCDKKYGVPYVSVLSVAVVNIILCPLPFETIVVVDVFLLVSSYVMIFISAMILRKRIPAKEYGFMIPGGYGTLCLVCIVPCVIAFLGFFINGTDFFIGGMIGIVSGPILYIIWKLRYGGLAKKDPALHPLNPRTRLAVGDLRRIAFNLIVLAAMGLLAYPWLHWFEGEWGPEYYAETYGGGFLANFDLMLNSIGAISILVGVLAVVIYAVSRKIEPRKGVSNN
ncbi:MAG: APC family permease, partial [Clostridiales Family XIII bacterium]|nr:APC family permease [Clostridiales Family XIII bacterium]